MPDLGPGLPTGFIPFNKNKTQLKKSSTGFKNIPLKDQSLLRQFDHLAGCMQEL